MQTRKTPFVRALPGLFVLTVLCGTGSQALAVEPDPANSPRPKIGLVLSGGGARGAAHVGVLQVLEEQRIPIDYIAGTSMGSIVGGLYATGMTTDELVDAVESIDWDDVFSDPTPRDERSFRRKRDDDLYLVKAKPGIDKSGLKFPAGIVQGQKIDLALTRLTRNVTHTEHFDDLAIPYRAVATDIVTGEAVVLEAGSLSNALRASMSVPAVIAPIIIDGRRLVDGGVANNLPVDVVREMGADIVIAVDISTPLQTEDKLESVIAIAGQLTSILTRGNTERQIQTLTDEDILLTPELDDITSADFARLGDAIPIGRMAAELNLEQLRRLSLPANDYADYRARLALPDTSVPVIDFIRINNQSTLKESIIANRIVYSKVGAPFDIAAAEEDVGRIYGLELFQNVRYELVQEDGRTGLEFYVKERTWGPGYLQLGASYNSNGDGNNIFNLAASYLRTALNPSGGELRLGFQVGEEPGVLIDFHQPLGKKGMYFANAMSRYGERLVTSFENDFAIAEFRLAETLIEVSAGREFGTWGEARVGLRYADGEGKVEIGDPQSYPPVRFQRGEMFVRLFADDLDSSSFPTSGYLTRLEWTASRDGLGADTDFEQVDIRAVLAKSWGRSTLLASADYGTTISGRAPIQSVFRRGGFTNLSGFNENELSGQHFGQISAAYYRRLGRIGLLPLYAGFSLEAGNVWQNRGDISSGNRLHAGSLFAGAETPIGPLYLAYGRAEGGADAYYLFLGRLF